jgi:hypothetical protein
LTLLYATLRYSTLLYSTLRYSTLLYATLRYSKLLDATGRYSTLLILNYFYDRYHFRIGGPCHFKNGKVCPSAISEAGARRPCSFSNFSDFSEIVCLRIYTVYTVYMDSPGQTISLKSVLRCKVECYPISFFQRSVPEVLGLRGKIFPLALPFLPFLPCFAPSIPCCAIDRSGF